MNRISMMLAAVLLSCGSALSQGAVSDENTEKAASFLNRIGQDTVCLVNNSFFIREMYILASHLSVMSNTFDANKFESNTMKILLENDVILAEDRRSVAAQLVDFGVSIDYINKMITGLVQKETAINIEMWSGIDSYKLSKEYMTSLLTKQSICINHVASIRGKRS